MYTWRVNRNVRICLANLLRAGQYFSCVRSSFLILTFLIKHFISFCKWSSMPQRNNLQFIRQYLLVGSVHLLHFIINQDFVTIYIYKSHGEWVLGILVLRLSSECTNMSLWNHICMWKIWMWTCYVWASYTWDNLIKWVIWISKQQILTDNVVHFQTFMAYFYVRCFFHLSLTTT